MAMRSLAMLVLSACDGGTTDETDTDPDTDTDTDSDTVPLVPVLEGTVKDADGNPVEGVSLFFCNYEICYQQGTDANGAYSYIQARTGSYALKVHADDLPTATTALAATEGQETRTLDIVLPDYQKSMPVPTSAGEYELADGFYVTLSASAISIPATSQDEVVGGTFVAPGDRMPIDEMPPTGTVAGIWYLEAYDATPTGNDLPFRIADVSGLGLADGDTVDIYVHSYKAFTENDQATSQWVSAGSTTVSGTEVTGALPYLSTVFLMKTN